MALAVTSVWCWQSLLGFSHGKKYIIHNVRSVAV